jgi:two-component system response regulator NreC
LTKVTVLIVDDHESIRHGLRAVLRSEPNAHIVGEAATGPQVVQQAEKLKPDVVIMDVLMPEFDGFEATRRIRAANPGTSVLILSEDDSGLMAHKALNAGADGYVSKSDLAAKLKAAVRAVCERRRYLGPHLSQKPADHPDQVTSLKKSTLSYLTSRELEVTRLLSLGKSSKEISVVLRISVRTVETHRFHIMRKLNVHSVTELLYLAFSRKLI